MKRIGYYALIMTIVIVMLPVLIVRGCGRGGEDSTPGKKSLPLSTLKIKVYVKEDNAVREMLLEEYVKGVVAAEMPVNFELEALKAQAIAARTFALSRMERLYPSADDPHQGADICSNYAHCQAWIAKEDAYDRWNIFQGKLNWGKISKAVNETEGMVIMYGGKFINPLFHSNSGGRTENVEDVWDTNPVPYLKSVESFGENLTKEYSTTTQISQADFIKKLKAAYPQMTINEKDVTSDIKVQEISKGNRVKTIQIGSITLKGTEVRTLLGLRSTHFTIKKEGDGMVAVTTIGYGHGVGMSQWGANYMAQSGATFEEILKHYYQGVQLQRVTQLP